MPPTSAEQPWERGRRRPAQLRARRRILVLCEDEKSSVLYLRKFPVARGVASIEVIGTGFNTASLMAEAIRRKQHAARAGEPFAEIWVVFDRDDHEDFYRAFDPLRGGAHNDIHACWSNECFELWYLLHFGLRQSPIGRADIYRELSRANRLGRAYAKSDDGIYDLLLDKLDIALRHADSLAAQNNQTATRRENPSTRVHQLVRLLRSLTPEALG